MNKDPMESIGISWANPERISGGLIWIVSYNLGGPGNECFRLGYAIDKF
jgi:hypothetical protein